MNLELLEDSWKNWKIAMTFPVFIFGIDLHKRHFHRPRCGDTGYLDRCRCCRCQLAKMPDAGAAGAGHLVLFVRK